jgi:Putative Flp pilus-assembly TadE/G-like
VITRESLGRTLGGERGAVIVIVAVWLASALALVTFAIDVGNWFVHRRHLQNQADAAALAGGDSFGIPCSNAPVEANAYNYGGPEANHPTSLYNAQYDAPAPSNFHLLINSTRYWNQGGQDFTDGGEPCTTEFLDVKLTESPHDGLSFFAKDLLPTINVHARVELRKEQTKAGSLPIAFPNPLPKEAAAIFIDETKPTNDPNQILAREPLTEVGPIGGGLDGWGGSSTSVPIASKSTGVVIATSGQTGALSGATFSNGTLGAICSQPLVSCYDATNNPPTNGVDYIRGYPSSLNGQQPNAPALGDAELFYTGGCSDAWFMSVTASCNIGIEAKIDARNALGNPIDPSNIVIQATSTSAAGGGSCLKPNQGCTLSFDSGSTQCALLQGPGRCWRSTTIPVGSITGGTPIFLNWKETTGTVDGKACTGNNCTGDFEGAGTIQRSFNADDMNIDNPNAGPLKVVTLYDCDAGSGCLTSGIQSFQIGTSPNLKIGIGIAGTLQNATNKMDANALCGVNAAGEHFSCLKVAVTNSGNTQALDCDPAANPWYNELAFGCAPAYTENDGTTPCPSKATLWASAQPWACIATTTGSKKSDVAKGLNLRILKATAPPNGSCPAFGVNGHNNWDMYDPTNRITLGFPPGDPRLVQAYLTAYGAFFNTSGTSTTIPIIGFGSFYITGWTPGQGQGFANPCQGNGDDPVPGNNGGIIVGHFVRYTDNINTGGGTELCDMSANAFGNCVPVLTQ